MARFFNTEDAFDPRYHFVRGGIGGLVEIDDTVRDVILEGTGEGGGSCWNGCVVACADMKIRVVSEEEWPIGCINFGCAAVRLWGDHLVSGRCRCGTAVIGLALFFRGFI